MKLGALRRITAASVAVFVVAALVYVMPRRWGPTPFTMTRSKALSGGAMPPPAP